jgi:hypothetical protein
MIGEVLYIAIMREMPNFMNTFKALVYAGFKQVRSKDARERCTALAVLVEMKLSKPN